MSLGARWMLTVEERRRLVVIVSDSMLGMDGHSI